MRAKTPKDGPGRSARLLANRRRAAIRWAVRNPRARRFALNHLFSQHLAAGTLCLVEMGDHALFVDPRDDKIAFTILSAKPWQRRQFETALAIARRHRKPDGQEARVFVDVGANIGTMTLYAALAGDFTHIIAIEPDAANRALLERNISHNNLADRVTILAAACSDHSGQMTLHHDAKNLGAHSLEPGFSKSQNASTSVRVDTLDKLITQAGFAPADVGFVKIDVEGHEKSVLQGMPQILAAHPAIMLEVSFSDAGDGRFRDQSGTLAAIPDFYATCHVLDEDLPEPRKLATFAPSAHQHDLLLTTTSS